MSVRSVLRGSSDLRVGRKMATFQLFYIVSPVHETVGRPTGPDRTCCCVHGAPTILQRIVTCDPVWKFDWSVRVIQKTLTQVFCDVTLCRWDNGYRRFEGTCRRLLQGSFKQSETVSDGDTRFVETSGSSNLVTRRLVYIRCRRRRMSN